MLVSNKIKCNKCGDVIESEYTHDFKYCKCESCAVDGGLDYARRLGTDFTDLSVYSEDISFNELRTTLKWGTRGKDGKQPLKYVLLCNLETEHIQAILDTQQHIKGTDVETFMKNELAWRKEHATE